MRKSLLFLASVLFCAITFPQSVPQGINYQAIARDVTGDALTNESLTIKLSIISGSSTGTVSWQEEHSVTTNEFGLFTAIIGQGTSTGTGTSVNFSAVDWVSGNHYIKVELNMGSGFSDMGTTELMSVPYALSSGSAANAIWKDDGYAITPNQNGSQNIKVTQSTTSSVAAIKGEGLYGPTYGYLGVQGESLIGGTSLSNSGQEIGVLGISEGTSNTDNYGVFGYSNYYGGGFESTSGNKAELGGNNYAGYFTGDVSGSNTPTQAEHLTRKDYVDSGDLTNAAAISIIQADADSSIAYETARAMAAETVLQANMDNQEWFTYNGTYISTNSSIVNPNGVLDLNMDGTGLTTNGLDVFGDADFNGYITSFNSYADFNSQTNFHDFTSFHNYAAFHGGASFNQAARGYYTPSNSDDLTNKEYVDDAVILDLADDTLSISGGNQVIFSDYFRLQDYSGKNITGENFSNKNLAMALFVATNATNTDFSNSSMLVIDARNIIAKNANFSHAILTNAVLTGADLSNSNMNNANLVSAMLINSNLSNVDLTNVNLSGSNLSNAILQGVTFSGVNFVGANLSGVDMSNVDLTGVDFSGVNLSNVNLSNANLNNVNLSGADLTNANLSGCSLENTIFNGTIVSNVDFSGLDLSEASIQNIDFSGVNFNQTDFEGLDLSGMTFNNAIFKDAIMTNVNFSNANLKNVVFKDSCLLSGLNLSGANLYQSFFDLDHGIDISSITFDNTDLSFSTMMSMNLSGINFSSSLLLGCNLRNSDLSSANLTGVNFLGADLVSVDFTSADLTNANLSGVDASSSDLTSSIMTGTNLSNVNLSNTTFSQTTQLDGTQFISTNIENVDFVLVDLSSAIFENITFSNTIFNQANIAGLNFSGFIFDGSLFRNTNMDNTNFTGASMKNSTIEIDSINIYNGHPHISGTNFSNANLTGSIFKSNLSNIIVQNPSQYTHERYIASGIPQNAHKIDNCDFSGSNLQGASFLNIWISSAGGGFNSSYLGANCSNVIFNNSILQGVSFANATINKTNFSNTLLENVSFMNADFISPIFGATVLDDVSFTGLDLTGKDFSGTSLYGMTKFDDCVINHVNFSGLDLNGSYWGNNTTALQNLVGVDFSGCSFGSSGTFTLYNSVTDCNFSNLVLYSGGQAHNTNLSFSGQYLQGEDIERCNFSGSKVTIGFSGAQQMIDCKFNSSETKFHLGNAIWDPQGFAPRFISCDLTAGIFLFTGSSNQQVINENLSNCDFSGSVVKGMFLDVNFQNSNFTQSSFHVDPAPSHIGGFPTSFQRCDFTNTKLSLIDRGGEDNPNVEVVLEDCNFTSADFSNTNTAQHIRLQASGDPTLHTSFNNAILDNIQVSNFSLDFASDSDRLDMSGASIKNSHFINCLFGGVNFFGTMEGSLFETSHFQEFNLLGANVNGVIMLNSIWHNGFSNICPDGTVIMNNPNCGF